MREKKLLIGFGAFLLLTLAIGIVGIYQIQAFTGIINELGQRHLPMGRSILQMKINNALYAMGVRNYIFWRVSRYLQAAAIASDIKFIEQSAVSFHDNLAQYKSLAVTAQQKKWADTVEGSITELETLGGNLINLTDSQEQDKDKINNLLMTFETKYYKMDDFLVETLSRSNLQDIETQLKLTNRQRELSILVLIGSLCCSVILGLVISSVVYRSLRRERRRRELLVQRMISLEEEERRNLSRQIHDQLSQDLSALKIYLELIGKDLPHSAKEQKEKVEKSRLILADLIDKGHNISELLRPPELDDLGLVESIGALISEHREITQGNYRYHRPQTDIKLASEFSLTLYRIVQESLTNIVKHAQAKNITVSLQKKNETINLAVIDDGIGFDYSQYQLRPHRRKEDRLKLGLQGLRERVELLGGQMEIKTAPRKGTKLTVQLPLKKT